MTGESLPVDKAVGDEASSGTVNQFGAFEMRATKVGEDSSIQRMIKLVQSADAGKAKIVGLADKWATWIVVIALTAAALTWIISGVIIRAVTILVEENSSASKALYTHLQQILPCIAFYEALLKKTGSKEEALKLHSGSCCT